MTGFLALRFGVRTFRRWLSEVANAGHAVQNWLDYRSKRALRGDKMQSAMLTDSEFAIYAPPEGPGIGLPFQLRLESWDKKDHPSQIALQAYLSQLEALVEPAMKRFETQLALDLDVRLPSTKNLTAGGHDLDNYLYPIIYRLGWKRFNSVSARKSRNPSGIRIGECGPPLVRPSNGWSFAVAQPRGSTDKSEWKRDLQNQIEGQVDASPKGPLEFHISYRLGSHRNWAYLWKPTIDALGPILGESPDGRAFHPNDDRIVRLALHRAIDNGMGHEVRIGAWWRAASDIETPVSY